VHVDINRALENTLTVCRNEWKYMAEVKMDFDPNLPTLLCMPGEINQVFLNIIINAAHAIGEVTEWGGLGKGQIKVSTGTSGEWMEIRISDTGCGIPEEVQDRIFDPFFTTKKVGKGTGQGLAIARSVVVDKHQGKIGFETEAGKSTTFTVRLPLQ
jgi:signal transduction histidine kinase